MKKRILSVLIAVLSLTTCVGCSNPFAGSTNETKEEVNVDEIKEQVKQEVEEENKKQQEQENKKQQEQVDKIREEVKAELENQQKSSDNKNVTVNVTNDTKPDTVVVVKETIPTSVYHSNSFIFANSSTNYLTNSQLRSLSNYQLGIARNEIYARHGYIFQLDTFRRYFESQSWYVGRYSNQNSISLNSIERYNVNLIKKEEDRRGIQW